LDALLRDVELFPTLPTTSAHTNPHPSPAATAPPSHVPVGRRLTVRMHSTWGDPHFMGLTAVELITCAPVNTTAARAKDGAGKYGAGTDVNGWCPARLEVAQAHMEARPRDLNVCGHTGDPRTLDKLVDGTNATVDDRHMWLIPFTPHGDHTMTIDVGADNIQYAGIKVWNYNKSIDDSHRGVRHVTIEVDGKPVYARSGWDGKSRSRASASRCIELRKAHGNVDYDYGQTIWFGNQPEATNAAMPRFTTSYVRPCANQDYETPVLPKGHVFKFALNATWGDP
jgi:hypothetical protein